LSKKQRREGGGCYQNQSQGGTFSEGGKGGDLEVHYKKEKGGREVRVFFHWHIKGGVTQ